MSCNLSVNRRYPEKGHGRSTVQGAVVDFRLASEVLGVLDGRDHPLDREEGGQVGGVRRDDDQSEEPPNAANDSCACCLENVKHLETLSYFHTLSQEITLIYVLQWKIYTRSEDFVCTPPL